MTLLSLSIILMNLVYIFNIEISKRQNIQKRIEYELGENLYEKHREYLFSRTNSYIADNLSGVTEESVHILLSSIEDKSIHFGSSYVEYNQDERKLVFYIYPQGEVRKKEYYSWGINEDIFPKTMFFLEEAKLK